MPLFWVFTFKLGLAYNFARAIICLIYSSVVKALFCGYEDIVVSDGVIEEVIYVLGLIA